MTRSLVTAGLAVACLASASPSRSATFTFQTIPGAHCHPSNQVKADYYRYDGGALLNTGTDRWDVLVGVCPISHYRTGAEVASVYVVLKDPERRSAWCNLYDDRGDFDQTAYVDWRNEAFWGGGLVTLEGGPRRGTPFAATVHCLVRDGAAIDRVLLLWRNE